MSSPQAPVPNAAGATPQTLSPPLFKQRGTQAATPGTTLSGPRARAPWRAPVVLWACLGLFFVALQTYVLLRWLVDGPSIVKAHGTYPFSTTRQVIGLLVPALTAVPVTLLTLKYARASRAARRASFDLLLVAGCVLSAWQDPLVNWMHPVVTVNTNQFLASSSWGPYTPLWQGAGPHQQAEMPIQAFVAGLGTVLAAISVSTGLQWIAKRRPGVRLVRLLPFAALIGVMIVATSEPFMPLLGFFVWSGATPALTLFSGSWYQFPVYELVVAGIYFGALGILRYWVNDHGETIVERGISTLPARHSGWLRLLAVAGGTNVAYAGYATGHVLFALKHGAPPAHLPSFFRPPAAYPITTTGR